MKALLSTLLGVLLLTACQNPAPPRSPQAENWTSPDFSAARLLDVAVLTPSLPEGAGPLLFEAVQETLRTQLIRVKGYASPSPEHITSRANGATGFAAARAANSDAALLVTVTKIDDSEFLGRGRLWVSGRLSLVGKDGELWRATFADHLEIAASDPDAVTEERALADTLAAVARQKLASLPRKGA